MGTPIDEKLVAKQFTTIYPETTFDILEQVKQKIIKLVVDGDWLHVEGDVKQTNNLIANYIGNEYVEDILIYKFNDIKQEIVFLRKNLYFMNILANQVSIDQRMNSFFLVITPEGKMNVAYSDIRGFKIQHVKKIMRNLEQKWEDYRLIPNRKNITGFDIVLGFNGNYVIIMRPNIEKYSRNRKIKVIDDALKRLKKYRKEKINES